MAEAYDVSVAPHCPLGVIALAACFQVCFACPNALIQEQGLDAFGPRALRYLAEPSVFEWEDGYAARPRAPAWASRSTRRPWSLLPARGTGGASPRSATPTAPSAGMVITDVSVECYQRPLERPIRNGKYTYATSDACIVRITTDEGATGIGLGDEGVGLSARAPHDPGHRGSRGRLLGEDPLASERIWASMWCPS